MGLFHAKVILGEVLFNPYNGKKIISVENNLTKADTPQNQRMEIFKKSIYKNFYVVLKEFLLSIQIWKSH